MRRKFFQTGGLKRWQIVLLSLALFLFGFLLFWPKTPQPPNTVASIADLESYMEKLADFGKPPGMSFVVIKNSHIIYSKAFGWADRPRKLAATPETVYHWWSCTKIATAIAILQLQEQGRLGLDDPVVQHLPFFKVQYPSSASKTITIQNLLNHSSGLPDPGFHIMSWIHHDGDPAVNQTAFLRQVLPEYSKLVFEPGDHTEYSNVGYMVLGAVIEEVTGQTYEAYIKEHILDPLGMEHTDFLYTREMEPNEAAGAHSIFDTWTPLIPFIAWTYVREISGDHVWFKRVYTDQTPPTGLIGSATDAALLAAAYLSGGELNGRRILSQESITLMNREGYMKAKEDDPHIFRRQGLGWQIYNDRNQLMIRHEGGGLGFNTIIQLYPEEHLGFVIFTNEVKCDSWRILNLAATLNW